MVKYAGAIRRKHSLVYAYECLCECGKICVVASSELRGKITKSCGCLQRETRTKCATHGKSKTNEYSIWSDMKRRCYNINNRCYHLYGLKGIKVCERWLNSFENFLADMGMRPSKIHSIERRNSDKDYSPENCKWATQTEQANNTSRNHKLTYNGITLSLSEWTKKLGFKRGTLATRIATGWTVEEALTIPPSSHNKIQKFRK